MTKTISFKYVLTLIVLTLLFSSPVKSFGADSTSFNPKAVEVNVHSWNGGPIGTIIAWPVDENPPDDTWLECNGQNIPSDYTVLRTLLNSNTVPDLRGQFLRGVGGKSDTLGKPQVESIYIPPNSVTMTHQGMDWTTMRLSNTDVQYLGKKSYSPFNQLHTDGGGHYIYNYNPYQYAEIPLFHAINSTGNFIEYISINSDSDITETRPSNVAVRYLIKALK